MVVRTIVVPLAGIYALFLTMLVVTERRRPSRVAGFPTSKGEPPGARRLLRHVAITTTGGYAAFLLLVGGYYLLVAGQTHRFLQQALVGGAFLAFAVALPAFALLGWLESAGAARSARPRRGSKGARPPS